MNDKIGIYLIKCIKNNKIYIGSAKNLDRRKNRTWIENNESN